MPPPISDSFEDRLHNALSTDDTVGSWYNSALAAVDSMVTSFDENVNAIFDSIEETVEAIVGDDDPPYEQENRRSNENRPQRRRSGSQDDGERSGINWQEEVAKICEEGDLENFVLQVRTQCANCGEEKEVGGFLSEQLLAAEKSSAILRILYVMQTVEEGELPAVIGVIREKCADKLEQLQSQTLCRSLAKQIYGPGRPATSSSSSGANEKKEEAKPEAKAKPPPKPTDLLDFCEPEAKSEVKPPVQKVAAPPKAKPTAKASKQSSTGPADLLDSSPPPLASTGLDLLDMASPTPLLTAQSGDLLSIQAIPPPATSASAGFTPSSDPFGTFQSSLPTTTTAQTSAPWAAFGNPAPASQSQFPNLSMTGMRPQGFGSAQTATGSAGYMAGVQFASPMDNFDPNAKPIPNTIANGPAMKMPGVAPGPTMGGDWSALSTSGFASGAKPQNQFTMGSSSASSFGSGRSQATGKKDLQLDDVLSNELAKMQSVS